MINLCIILGFINRSSIFETAEDREGETAALDLKNLFWRYSMASDPLAAVDLGFPNIKQYQSSRHESHYVIVEIPEF